ncbi:MAG: sigma-70 family RNA polymerase sigma factor, partial [Clostridia bacterium]|nr:sigma-70 family RNA polymerase sigma factor [Clostridia bacterium]
MLSAEETVLHLRKAKQGDNSSKEILLENNTLLIKSIIRRFKNKGVEYDDLYQLGCIGFLKAINNFDESFGVRFSTYAVPMIIGEVKRFLRDDGAIKVSRVIKTQARAINSFIENYN